MTSKVTSSALQSRITEREIYIFRLAVTQSHHGQTVPIWIPQWLGQSLSSSASLQHGHRAWTTQWQTTNETVFMILSKYPCCFPSQLYDALFFLSFCLHSTSCLIRPRVNFLFVKKNKISNYWEDCSWDRLSGTYLTQWENEILTWEKRQVLVNYDIVSNNAYLGWGPNSFGGDSYNFFLCLGHSQPLVMV